MDIGTPKSQDSYRTIPVPENVRYCAKLLRDTPNRFVWESPKNPGIPCNPSHFSKLFKEAVGSVEGVRVLTPHCCRHTFVSQMQALGVDLLFAMERVQIQLKEGVLFMPEVMLEVPAIDGAVTPLVRVYVPGRNAPLYSVSKADTICWELTPELSYNQMVEDASGHAGALSVPHLIPHWKELHRYYFDGGNADMRDAGVYVREQEWKEAADLWHQLYDKRKGKIRMQAAYNLALYYEMQNDLEQAKYYLDAAASLAKEGSGEAQLIMFYQLQLEEQMKQSQRLQLQMKRFEP